MVKSQSKTKKSEKPKALTPEDKIITRLACKDWVVWNLYNECLKAKGDKDKEIKIYLQAVDFPVSVGYKEEFLNKLKKKKIIKDYKIEIEEENSQSIRIERLSEPDVDLLPFVSHKDLKSVPKDSITANHVQYDYVATINCKPQKVIKELRNDFKKADQKRKEILKRKKVEKFFKKEQVLKCEELRFGLETGNVIYGGTVANLMPDGQEYKVLKVLMENCNHRVDFKTLCKTAFGNQRNWQPNQKNTSIKRELGFIIRNIKRKLEIIGPTKNKDLFFSRNGYMVTCE